MSAHFDLHTMFMVCSTLTIASGFCMVLVQLTGRPYPGFRHWTVGVLAQGVAYTLFAYAHALPHLVSTVVGNLFFILYSMLYSRGTRVFAGRAAPRLPMILGLFYAFSVTYYFSAVSPNLKLRVAAGALCFLPFYFDCAWVIWRDPAYRYAIVRHWLAGAFALFVLINPVRICLMFAFEPNRQEIWAQSDLQTLFMTVDTALSLSIVIGVCVLNFERASSKLKDQERLLIADVAARKRVEAVLRESELRYRILVERSPESVIVHRDGIIIFANPAAIRMFGAESIQNLTGKTFLDLVDPDLRAEVLAPRESNADRGAGDRMTETQFLRLDGTKFDVESQSASIVYDGAMATQVTARDISERKRAAAERQEFAHKLQETQKLESLGVLAGGIAHDFNNILTSIFGNASLARLELPSGSPAAENLTAITEGSQRAADLCRQMLAYSGKGSFVVRRLSLNRLVEETTHLLKISISKKAELRFNLSPALAAIDADATQIRQVIMNLVINASEAIGDHTGVISLNTSLAQVTRDYLREGGLVVTQEMPAGPYVCLEVSDTGCGMSPETQAKIFDPFFTTKFSGRGLGLAAVLGIVRSHKGALKLSSEPGRGTTFKLLFPCSTGTAETAAVDQVVKTTWRGQGWVLVVDDEESVRSTAAAMLRKLGFEVVLAADGREALAAFQAEPDRYALVLLDLTMPKMDGQQSFLELRSLRRNVPVVLMSGFNEQEVFSQFAEKGSLDFLQKPFGFEAMNKVVQGVLAGAPQPK